MIFGLQVHQLRTVLVKKRDPHTQVSFLDNISGVSFKTTFSDLLEEQSEPIVVSIVPVSTVY